MLSAFVRWHLRLGFVRLYLYFDDPATDPGIAVARRLRQAVGRERLVVIPCDSGLRSQWSGLETACRWDLTKVQHLVEVRQLLNTELALRRAHSDGDVDWCAACRLPPAAVASLLPTHENDILPL